MTLEEFNILEKKDELLSVNDLENHNDRTLLYGYTCERETFHVYLKNNEFHRVIYHDITDMRELKIEYNGEFIPDKRLYPESCDYEFCCLLKERGIELPFTWFNEKGDLQDPEFYGFCGLYLD